MADALSLLPPGYRPISPDGLMDQGDARSATLDAPAQPDALSMLPQGYVPMDGGQPSQDAGAPGDPLAAQMDARVAQERTGGTMQNVDDFVRLLASGTQPLGSYADRFAAGGNAGLNAISGGHLGEPYDQGLAHEKAYDRAVDKDWSGTVAHLPVIGDVSGGGLAKFAGGVASLPAAPFVKVIKGASYLPRAANYLLNGIGYGGLYGSGIGDTTDERTANAETGAKWGAALAPLGPLAESAGSNIASALMRPARALPAPLRGMSRKAVGNVASDFQADLGPATGGNYVTKSSELGRQGMLADMGMSMRKYLGGLATKPEVNAPAARAIEGRATGAEGRLETALNQAMGRPVNVPQTIENMQKAKQAASKPVYDRFYQTPVNATPTLDKILQRANAAGAYQRAAKKMAIEGIDPNTPSNSGRFYDLIKRSVDDIARDASPGSDDQRIARGLSSDLKAEVDRILSPSDPKKSVWAIARTTAGEHLRLKEAFESGQAAFSKKLTADQMAHELRRMSPEERQIYRLGARQQIRAAAEEASTSWGANPDTAERKMLSTRNAENKAKLVSHNPAAARELMRTVKAETEFARTRKDVLQGSESASRIEQGKRHVLDQTDVMPHDFQQILVKGLRKVGNIVTGGLLTEVRTKAAADAVKMLTAQGASRDQIAKGLRAYLRTSSMNTQQKNAVALIVRNVIRGSTPALVNAQAKHETSANR